MIGGILTEYHQTVFLIEKIRLITKIICYLIFLKLKNFLWIEYE